MVLSASKPPSLILTLTLAPKRSRNKTLVKWSGMPNRNELRPRHAAGSLQRLHRRLHGEEKKHRRHPVKLGPRQVGLPITDRPLLFTPKNEGELHRLGPVR